MTDLETVETRKFKISAINLADWLKGKTDVLAEVQSPTGLCPVLSFYIMNEHGERKLPAECYAYFAE